MSAQRSNLPQIAASDAMNPSDSAPKPLPTLQVVSAEEPRGALAADPPLIPTEDFLSELASESARLKMRTLWIDPFQR